jgi:hypothetical protein
LLTVRFSPLFVVLVSWPSSCWAQRSPVPAVCKNRTHAHAAQPPPTHTRVIHNGTAAQIDCEDGSYKTETAKYICKKLEADKKATKAYGGCGFVQEGWQIGKDAVDILGKSSQPKEHRCCYSDLGKIGKSKNAFPLGLGSKDDVDAFKDDRDACQVFPGNDPVVQEPDGSGKPRAGDGLATNKFDQEPDLFKREKLYRDACLEIKGDSGEQRCTYCPGFSGELGAGLACGPKRGTGAKPVCGVQDPPGTLHPGTIIFYGETCQVGSV